MIRPRDYATDKEYYDACEALDISSGRTPEQARFDREMYEANGEEYEGQYGGSDGWGPS